MRKLIKRIILCVVLHLALFASAFATDITISSFQFNWPYGGTTLKLRLYASNTWTDTNNFTHLGGQSGTQQGYYQEIICSVSGTIATCPQTGTIVTPSTTDSVDKPQTRITGSLFDEKLNYKKDLFTSWVIPATPTTVTWTELVIYNNSNPRPLADTYATTARVLELINQISPAPKSSESVHGIGKTDVPPASSVNPIFVGENSPLVREFNVEKYGAVAGDLSDDTTSIQAANTALQAAGGGRLVFPSKSGEYRVSGCVDIKSATTVTGQASAYPGVPFGDAGQPGGSSKIRLTSSNASVFCIGSHVTNVKIENLSGVSDSLTGTSFVKARGHFGGGGDPTNTGSSFNFEFANLYIKDFDVGFDVQDSVDTGGWQFDNVKFSRIDMSGVNKGFFINTQNADTWLMESIKVGPRLNGYCIYAYRTGDMNIINFQCVKDPDGDTDGALLYISASHGLITVSNSITEGPAYFIDTLAGASGNSAAPITLLGNAVQGGIRLLHSENIVSIGNQYYFADSVVSSGAATDVKVWSFGDSVHGTGAAQENATPFVLTGNGKVTELGTYRNKINTTGGTPGLSVTPHLGVGNSDASDNAVLTIGTTSLEQSAMKPSIRLQSTNASIFYDTFRDSGTGYRNEIATQSGARGFWFNSNVYTPTHVFLTNRSVTDAVTNGTTTLTSASAAFVSGDVGAQIVIVDSTGLVKVTTIAAVGGSTSITLTSAPSWSSTGNTIILTKNSGISDTIGAGAPAGGCTTGSTYRRTDGGAASSFYVCESSAWVAK